MTHRCRRVYNNGDAVLELRDEQTVATWLEYNSTFRWGCTLLVDGVLKHRGYHSESRAQALVDKYASDCSIPSPSEAQPVDQSTIPPKENG